MMEERRIYFDTTSLDDALLKSYVTPGIVEESSNYVESVALSYGVSKDMIATPTPYMVSRLATLFSYMTAAHRKAQFSIGKSADNDSFALKFKLYKELLDDLLSMLTAETFTNGVSAKKRSFPSTIPISRR